MSLQHIPADIPPTMKRIFEENYRAITHNTQNLFIFAADQKIEHLNDDFYGPEITPQANDPHHIFEIAQQGGIGALATQLGLIARYGTQYPEINYIAKLNAKTNLISPQEQDPCSEQLWSVTDVVEISKNSNLAIRGVAYTVYPGSAYESVMLSQAAQVVTQAHRHGLVAILWIYPRGKSVKKNPEQLFVDAAGLANALGADFVKLYADKHANKSTINIAAQAAGTTKIICAGGAKASTQELLTLIKEQLANGSHGAAIGRNIFQRPREEAISLSQALAKIIYNQS